MWQSKTDWNGRPVVPLVPLHPLKISAVLHASLMLRDFQHNSSMHHDYWFETKPAPTFRLSSDTRESSTKSAGSPSANGIESSSLRYCPYWDIVLWIGFILLVGIYYKGDVCGCILTSYPVNILTCLTLYKNPHLLQAPLQQYMQPSLYPCLSLVYYFWLPITFRHQALLRWPLPSLELPPGCQVVLVPQIHTLTCLFFHCCWWQVGAEQNLNSGGGAMISMCTE